MIVAPRSRGRQIVRRTRGARAATFLLLMAIAPAPAATDSPAAYVEGTVSGGGALTGTVRGAAPAVPYNDAIINKDRSVCGDRKPSEALVRAADGALKNAVVFIQA